MTRHPTSPCMACCRRSGFTLIELLLAVAIFAVVLLAIQSVFFSALTLRNRTVSQLDNALPLDRALEILKRDLTSLVPPGGTFSGPFQSATSTRAGLGPASTASTNNQSTLLPGRVVSPVIHTASGIIDDWKPWAEISRVTYYLGTPTNHDAGLDLYRAVTRNLLPIVEDQPEHQWLLGGVEALQFLYFDGLQWLESWDSDTAPTPLPGAVKVQLWLTVSRESPRPTSSHPIELIVPIQVQTASSDSESTTEEGS